MSGTIAKITGFICENGSAVSTGTTLRFKWSPYSGADEIQLQGASDGKTWEAWHRVPGTATATTKGGVADGQGWQFRVEARKGGRAITGSASDPVSVRVGPAPVVQPPPAPTPTPAATPTAADLGALASRVAALEKAQPATGTTATAGVLPADLPRLGPVVTGDGTLVVRDGAVGVATAK